MKQEIKYLQYRMYGELDYSLERLFKRSREVLVVFPDGEHEELEMESFHLDSLRKKFPELDDATIETEYVFSCKAARCGYIIFIIDSFGISIFFPDKITIYQKNKVVEILLQIKQLNKNYLIYAGVVGDDVELNSFNDGRGMLVDVLIEEIDNISLDMEVRR